MKKLLMFCLFPIWSYAQPNCTKSIEMDCNGINTEVISGNTCIFGVGIIPETTEFKDWEWLQFHSNEASIVVKCPLKMEKETSIYIEGTISLWNVQMEGADTIFIGENALLTIKELSYFGNNVIVLEEGARVFNTELQEYYSGEFIFGVPIISQNRIDFEINEDVIKWFVEDSDDIQIQYSEDKVHFSTIHRTNKNSGYLVISESGFYRVVSGSSRSQVLTFKMQKLNKVFYYMGNFYTEKPLTPYYGTKTIR